MRLTYISTGSKGNELKSKVSIYIAARSRRTRQFRSMPPRLAGADLPWAGVIMDSGRVSAPIQAAE